MTQAKLAHHAMPRAGLLTSAILSTLATTAPPKTYLTALHAGVTLNKKDPSETAKKQYGPRYGAGKKVNVTSTLSREFGGLAVAHHYEQHGSVGTRNFGGFTVIY